MNLHHREAEAELVSQSSRLTEQTFNQGLEWLALQDTTLAQILNQFGTPPMWVREPGYPTLVRIILEQQVSLASALAAYERLLAAVPALTPAHFLQLDDVSLKTIGFSRQKTAYVRYLSQAIVAGELDLDALVNLDDYAVRAELTKIKGIGNWTSDIYLLMALGRPNVWPSGDLALIIALQKIKGLDARPNPAEMETLSLPWQPWRAVAARILWHFYLNHQRVKKTAD